MGTAATRAKRKWNKEHYTNITAALDPSLASRLKSRCKDDGVSVTSVISTLVTRYLDDGFCAFLDNSQNEASKDQCPFVAKSQKKTG
jgi:hypothetical protein